MDRTHLLMLLPVGSGGLLVRRCACRTYGKGQSQGVVTCLEVKEGSGFEVMMWGGALIFYFSRVIQQVQTVI